MIYPKTVEEWNKQYMSLINKIDIFEPIELIDPDSNANDYMVEILNLKWLRSSYKRREIICLLREAENLKLVAEKWYKFEFAKKITEAKQLQRDGKALYPSVSDRDAYALQESEKFYDMVLAIDLIIVSIKSLEADIKQIRRTLENVGHNFRNWNK